jgi:hypothetical protein
MILGLPRTGLTDIAVAKLLQRSAIVIVALTQSLPLIPHRG